VVSNDYVVRWSNRFFQLLPPVVPGLRGGRVVVEERRDGSVVLRFGTHRLKYREIEADPEKTAGEGDDSSKAPRPRARPSKGSGPHKPAANHPWRRGQKR
jgi:hypothetical protein